MKKDTKQIIQKTTEKLKACCNRPENTTQEALWMLEELTKKTHAQLIAQKEIDLTQKQEEKLECWIKERIEKNKPLQYILGHVPFGNIDILVEKPILIPRPETENWTCWLIDQLKNIKDKINILDLGCGSGCISLLLAKNLLNSQVYGVDINPKAIKLANKNLKHNNIKNAHFNISDFYSNLDNTIKFDLIVSNPPYIELSDWENLKPTVKNWEDKKALVAEKHGFKDFETIIQNAKNHLRKNENFKKNNIPQIVLEIGINQEKNLEQILKKNGFSDIKMHKDLQKITRWITAGF